MVHLLPWVTTARVHSPEDRAPPVGVAWKECSANTRSATWRESLTSLAPLVLSLVFLFTFLPSRRYFPSKQTSTPQTDKHCPRKLLRSPWVPLRALVRKRSSRLFISCLVRRPNLFDRTSIFFPPPCVSLHSLSVASRLRSPKSREHCSRLDPRSG